MLDIEQLNAEYNRIYKDECPDVIWFGEHEGRKFSELPTAYLGFLVRHMKSAKIRNKAAEVLKKRYE